MKDLIRQILREETSGLTDGQIKSAYSLMNMITKGYQWYYDTPEQPFELTPGSIWLINPDTKKWMLELKKSGNLWHYIKTSPSFYDYLNIRSSDFESFIELWVEDVLERGVVSTHPSRTTTPIPVEDVLERGVVSTRNTPAIQLPRVEDALKNGIQLK